MKIDNYMNSLSTLPVYRFAFNYHTNRLFFNSVGILFLRLLIA